MHLTVYHSMHNWYSSLLVLKTEIVISICI